MVEYPTVKVEVKVYVLKKACPECINKPNPGCVLQFKGYVLTCNPPLWIHECPNCKKTFNLDNKYPLNIYEEQLDKGW